MELIRVYSLQHYAQALAARGERIPLGVVLRVSAEACAGLHAAHETRGDDGMLLGLVHSDVSPQNVDTVTATGLL